MRRNSSQSYPRRDRSPSSGRKEGTYKHRFKESYYHDHNVSKGNYHYERRRNISPKEKSYDRFKDSGLDYFESRRKIREESNVTFWPLSEDISESEEEKGKYKNKKNTASDSEQSALEKKFTIKKERRGRRRHSSDESDFSDASLQDKKYNVDMDLLTDKNIKRIIEISEIDDIQEIWIERKVDYTSDVEIGPVLAPNLDKKDSTHYGSSLFAGEGEAMAAYIQSGRRIPRRGEIGLSSDQIESFENQGFVMSGSRHQRMNAVRIRKENQVISAEEKRNVLKFAQEERAKRENRIIADLRELVDSQRKSKEKNK